MHRFRSCCSALSPPSCLACSCIILYVCILLYPLGAEAGGAGVSALVPLQWGKAVAAALSAPGAGGESGHWPQHHLFCFFDRDGDGAVRVFVSNWVAGVGFFRVKAIGKCYDETRKELK